MNKPTVNNTRYVVNECGAGYALVVDGQGIGAIMPPRVGRTWFWEMNASYSHGTEPSAQEAIDALVKAYEQAKGGAIMTADYSKLDTAALVQAVDALMAEITPGAWEWDAIDEDLYFALNNGDPKRVRVIEADQDVVCITDADAAFIAAAPALVRALVTRLREAVPAYKFNVGDRVRVLPLPQNDGDNAVYVGWPAGLETTITARVPGKLLYMIEDSLMSFREASLERVENG